MKNIGFILIVILSIYIIDCVENESEPVLQKMELGIKVVDDQTKEPLPNTIVDINNKSLLTDNNGYVVFDSVKNGQYKVHTHRYGYLKKIENIYFSVNKPQIIEIGIEKEIDILPYKSDRYKKYYEIGWLLAEEEMRNNSSTIYIDYNYSEHRKQFHFLYKLPIKVVGVRGDIDKQAGILSGHNQRILKEINEQGYLPYDPLWEYKGRVAQLHVTRPEGYEFKKIWSDGPFLDIKDSISQLHIFSLSFQKFLYVSNTTNSRVFPINIDDNDTLKYFDILENKDFGYLFKDRSLFYLIDFKNIEIHPFNAEL